jgi:PAS domain S-box-containing protein
MLSRRDPFQSLAANSRVMIWTAGPNKLCNWVNRAWLDFTGRTIEQELGNGWAEGVHPDDLSTCLSTYTTAFDYRREFSMEYRLRRYDGVYRWVLDIGGPYFSDDGKFLGYFGSCIDVTDSKHHNGASRTAQPELDRLGLNTSIGEGAGESIPLERQFGAIPTETEVRAALDRIAGGHSFRASPQLAAFLRFVIEATLRGEAERIKGYTIAVEALGRGQDFDPQIDPIVRVEAGRLRRALEHYYAGPGASDSIVIDVPRGRYVPTFRYRGTDKAAAATAANPSEGASLAARALHASLRYFATTPNLRRGLLSLALIVPSAIAVLLAIGDLDRSTERASLPPAPTETFAKQYRTTSTNRQLTGGLRAGHGMPVIVVQPINMVGMPAAGPTVTVGALRSNLRDALARFDALNVASDVVASPNPSPVAAERLTGSRYRLGGAMEKPERGMSLSFWLVDESDGDAVVWSRSFGVDRAPTAAPTEEQIVRQVTMALAEPFGIIHAREHGKADLDPRYACLLDALVYWQTFNLDTHFGVRGCLERMIELDPTFTAGFAALEMVYIREYYNDLARPGDSPPLDRALKAAQRAVALKPQSAWAHAALLGSYYARGQIAAALAEGETALSLNPFDPFVVSSYGIRLVGAGQIEKGSALLKEVTADNIVINANIVDFYLFLVAYLKGDREIASRHANLSFSDRHLLGLVARTLAAAADGDRTQAMQTRDRLLMLYPAFRNGPRDAIAKFIPSTEIVDRLVGDFAKLDRGAAN